MRTKTVDRLLKNTPKDIQIFTDLYADLVVRINQLLREKALSKKDLAEKLEKNQSEISKWLGGDHNFTLRSIAKLAAELGEPLLEVPPRSTYADFEEEGFVCRVHTFVSCTKVAATPNGKVWESPEIVNDFNESMYAA